MMNNLKQQSKLLSSILLIVLVFVLVIAFDRKVGISFLDKFIPRNIGQRIDQKIVSEESVVTEIAEKVSPSVVTISAQTPQRQILQYNPFGGFSSSLEGGKPQDIGTGFIVSSDGLILTNKHVVSENTRYKVITKDDKEYEVKEISKDPNNDIAVIRIEADNLTPVELGDSSNLKVGQFVIAIGTALGEFRHTVTTGVISGLGRGIIAGSSFAGFAEPLDNVIQTDAAINPGNSGGPLLNSSGQVIGVNVAVAEGAQNIGFAIPINVIKDSLEEFKANGKFPAKAFLGVQYQMLTKQAALLNSVPEGAYVVEVIPGSPSEWAGVKVDDIITALDGEKIEEKSGGLAKAISKKKPGNTVSLEVWRNGELINLKVTLSEFSQ